MFLSRARETRTVSLNPYYQEPLGDAKRWLLMCCAYGIATFLGWLLGELQLVLVVFQSLFGLGAIGMAWLVIKRITKHTSACGQTWNLLNQIPTSQIAPSNPVLGDSFLAKGALIVLESVRRNGQCDLNVVAAGLVGDLRRRAKWISIVAQVAPEFGLLGTTIGLWMVFASVAGLASQGLEELTGGILATLAGVGLAVSTTLIGAATSVMVGALYGITDGAIDQLEEQLKSQLGLLARESDSGLSQERSEIRQAHRV